MGPIAQAVLVAALTAFAATGASAGEEKFYTITLQKAGLSAAPPSAGKGEQLEIQSFQWGPRQSTSGDGFIREKPHVVPGEAEKVESFTVKQRVKPADAGQYGQWVADVERPPAQATRPVGTSDLTMKRGTSPSANPGGVAVASGDVNDSAGFGASQSVTVGGTRTEAPVGGLNKVEALTWKHQANPSPSGSLRAKVKFPWTGCRVGARYASLQLAGYLLQDVTVADCGGTAAGPEESITFVYGKLVIK